MYINNAVLILCIECVFLSTLYLLVLDQQNVHMSTKYMVLSLSLSLFFPLSLSLLLLTPQTCTTSKH